MHEFHTQKLNFLIANVTLRFLKIYIAQNCSMVDSGFLLLAISKTQSLESYAALQIFTEFYSTI
jgi:hypothetical protein